MCERLTLHLNPKPENLNRKPNLARNRGAWSHKKAGNGLVAGKPADAAEQCLVLTSGLYRGLGGGLGFRV